MEPLGIKRHTLAKRAGISSSVLDGLVNGQRKITVNIAWRLSKAFNTTPEYWLNLQQARDIWDTRGNENLEIESFTK
jgi:addiction module HigA family antidote